MKQKLFALGLGLWSLLAACGGDSDDGGSNGPKAGLVTLRFVNPTSTDVYIDVTIGTRYGVAQGSTTFSGNHDCTAECGAACQCTFCGAPQPQIRRIVPGEWVETTWDGTHYTLEQACGNDTSCSCDVRHELPFGDYTITMSGAASASPPGQPTAADPDVFIGDLDPTWPACSATLVVTLGAEPQTLDVPFSCP
jgi:hypothetical protein